MSAKLLKLLDELKIADNTIVIYSADNGAQVILVARRRHHPLPRREGHHLGGRRARADAVALARPGQGGSVSNGIQSHEDLFTTLAAAAGAADMPAKLRESHKVHVDGVDNLAHWTGRRPRRNVSSTTTTRASSPPCASAIGSRT
jgi:arylsulfatase A-like enzyme